MDITQFKQLAKQLHSFLKPQLGPAFKLGQAQELMATLPGLRSWSEVLAFQSKLEAVTLDERSLSRLASRVEEQYMAKVSPEGLHDALVPSEDPMLIPMPRPAIVGGRIPQRWICDVCGEHIDSVDRGYVVWKSKPAKPDHSFRIIHKSKCDIDDNFNCSNPLRDYVGQEGLNKLLAFLSPGPILRRFEKQPRSSIPNPDEFVDFIRRVQIPNYDLARPLFNDPRVIDEFRDAGEVLPFQPENLARILRDYDKPEEE